MRILLVQTPTNLGYRRQDVIRRIYPLGLSYVASALVGHEVTFFDANLDENDITVLMEKVKETKPEIVGLSLRNAWPIADPIVEWCRLFINETKKVVQHECKFIVGGAMFSLFPTEFMKKIPEINYGILYEGEESMLELLRKLDSPESIKGLFIRRKEKIIFTGPREKINFSVSPAPKRDFFKVDKYQLQPFDIGLQTKRGCSSKCVYCSYPMVDGNILRLRQPKHVVDEIESLVNVYGVKTITFVDNIFNVPTHHAEEICCEMVKRKIDIQWTAWFSPKGLSKDFVRLAKLSGCNRFEFSPDGFSDNTLCALGKDITNRDIKDTYHIFKNEAGIKVRYNFFFWPPGQDLIGLIGLLWFGVKLKLALRSRLERFLIGRIILFPKTILYKMALKQGVVTKDTDILFSSVRYYWYPKWTVFLYNIYVLSQRLLKTLTNLRK